MASEKIEEKASYWLSLENEGNNLKNNENFQAWIKNEENKKSFEEQKELYEEIHSLPKDFLDGIKNEVKQKREEKNRRKKLFLIATPLISAACILALIYTSFFMQTKEFSQNYIASNKIREKIVLPDNSIVSLDANTSMEVNFYEDRREVFISEGKAYFSVVSSKKRPFFVKTKNIDIKVLGTKFEVINSNKFQVNVTEGEVGVSNKNAKLLALVTKEQSLSLDKYYSLKSIENKPLDSIARWTKGEFIFKQESLKDVISEFIKYEHIEVEIKDKSLEDLPVSGSFKVSEFDKFIKALPLVHPIKLENQNGKFIINRRNY